jgi:HEAT repeat protein
LEGLGKATPDDKEIERLVKQLGSDEFKEREAASNALGKIGKPALTALRKAAKDGDLEIRSRAARLILALQDGLAHPIDLGAARQPEAHGAFPRLPSGQ